MTEKIVVKGIRVCRECKGICHRDSWRTRIGQRRSYWCCEVHLRQTQERKLQKLCARLHEWNWQEVSFETPGSSWSIYRDEFWEPVIVISK